MLGKIHGCPSMRTLDGLGAVKLKGCGVEPAERRERNLPRACPLGRVTNAVFGPRLVAESCSSNHVDHTFRKDD